MNSFGIDKTTLVNVSIEQLDLEHLYYLKSHGSNITINEAKNKGFEIPLTNGSIGSFTLINIIDNVLFSDFTIGTMNNKSYTVYYTTLSLTASYNDHISNLMPLSYDEYISKLRAIEDYFNKIYHIKLSLSECRFKEIEINRTFTADYQFEEYTPIFDTLNQYMPNSRYSIRAKYGHCGDSYDSTYEFSTKRRKRSNKSAKRLKIYDKTKELKTKRILIHNKQYIRFEYVLRDEQIEKNLTTNKVSDISDTILLSFFTDSIVKDVFETLDRADKDINSTLTQLYKEIKTQYKRGYLREFFHRASHIAYCNEQIEAVAITDMKLNSHYKRNKTLLNSIMPPTDMAKKIAELKIKLLVQ